MGWIVVKYLSQEKKTGHWQYRRRVPEALRELVGKTEFLKVLGPTQNDALASYAATHDPIERLIRLAKQGITHESPKETRATMIALLAQWHADPFSKGQDDNERTWREEAANNLLEPFYKGNIGEWVDVPARTEAVASALLSGVPTDIPSPTVTDAFKAYLKENAKVIPEQLKKQTQRYGRAEHRLVRALGGDRDVSKITREDARRWRDAREAGGAAPATVQREMNDIRAVLNYAINELDTPCVNPFIGLKLSPAQRQAQAARQEARDPLPQKVIEDVYKDLANEPTLLAIWTLLDWTGARPSEIRMLTVEEVDLSGHAVPHITIRVREDRSLKTSWSSRKLPLVGAALATVQAIHEAMPSATPDSPLFPRYAGEGGMDNLSTALRKRVRRYTQSAKHTPYSLRHNMKDRLRAAEVFPELARAIEGHALSTGQDGSYGAGFSLEQKQAALVKALAGYRAKG